MRLISLTLLTAAIMLSGPALADPPSAYNKKHRGTLQESAIQQRARQRAQLPDWNGTISGAIGGAVVRPNLGLGGGQPSSGCYSLGC